MKTILVLAGLVALAQEKALEDKEPRPIDFKKVDRSIAKPPQVSVHARYGIYLFGLNGEKRAFAILDKTDEKGAYDVLWLDLDADGDLTEAGERFTSDSSRFSIGDFTDPGTGARHKGFEISWSEEYTHFKMLWRGEKVTFGGYGPERETYAQFATTPKDAPVFVPGWDRPFEFEHWMSGTFTRGQVVDFKVFVGNRGDRTGAFSSVDDKFLGTTEHPVATLIYADAAGAEKRTTWTLKKRC